MYEDMFEVMLVASVVAAVLVLAGRLLYRTAAGKGERQCCLCASCVCSADTDTPERCHNNGTGRGTAGDRG